MKTLIIYDSVFGNTEKIARAIGQAFGTQEKVEIVKVSEAKPENLAGLGLLIVGSPTRAFRATPAMMQFLGKIPANGLKGVRVGAFDTRVPMDGAKIPGFLRALAKVFGYAAEPMAKKLAKKGGVLAALPEGFFVTDSEGPLKEGELERAGEWAKSVGRGK